MSYLFLGLHFLFHKIRQWYNVIAKFLYTLIHVNAMKIVRGKKKPLKENKNENT